MAPNAEDIIDVDGWSSESDSSDIVLTGFKRDPSKSKSHTEELDTAGVVFIGFHSQAGQQPKPPTSSIRTAKQDKPATKHTRGLTVKAPPSRIRSHEPSTTNPHFKRPREVIAISDSDDDEPVPKKPIPTKRVRSSRNTTQAPDEPLVVEDPMQLDEVEYEEDPYDYTVPDIDSEQLWTQPKKRCETPLDIRDEDARLGAEQLDIDFEKCMLNDHGGRHGFHRTLRHQRQSPLPLDRSHTGQSVAYRQHHVHSILQHVRPTPLRTRWTPWRFDFLTWTGFRHWPPGRPIRKAPKDINTIVQCNGLVVMASAVSEGNADDIPGPENRAGALAVWANGTEHILEAHSTDFVPESGQARDTICARSFSPQL
ncbi:hypothetical protein BD413DRAFT_98651 [Trametes elegans]|nr:hypothetical protein BD413DRAFT_98651 [Trametes elegans]